MTGVFSYGGRRPSQQTSFQAGNRLRVVPHEKKWGTTRNLGWKAKSLWKQRSENIGDSNELLAKKTDIEVVKVNDDIISVSESDDDELSPQKDVQQEIDSERFDKTNQTLLGHAKDN